MTTNDESRVFCKGLLSKRATFCLLVRGEMGVKEMECLIARMELDREILAEPDPERTNLEVTP